MSSQICALSKELLEVVLEYAFTFTPTPKEMFTETGEMFLLPGRGSHYLTRLSFNYPVLEKSLSHLVQVCDYLTSSFGIESSLSTPLLGRVAHITYVYSQGGPDSQRSNPDRVVKNVCYWDMNLSIKVDQAIKAPGGCQNPAVLRIFALFERYNVQPESTQVIELRDDPNVKQVEEVLPEEEGRLLTALPTGTAALPGSPFCLNGA